MKTVQTKIVSENIVALKERERECERWLRISDAILSTRLSKK